MNTLEEIEAAALQLSYVEQQALLAKLEEVVQRAQAIRNSPSSSVMNITEDPDELTDPVLAMIKRNEQLLGSSERTDIARNYKEYLYGCDSGE